MAQCEYCDEWFCRDVAAAAPISHDALVCQMLVKIAKLQNWVQHGHHGEMFAQTKCTPSSAL